MSAKERVEGEDVEERDPPDEQGACPGAHGIMTWVEGRHRTEWAMQAVLQKSQLKSIHMPKLLHVSLFPNNLVWDFKFKVKMFLSPNSHISRAQQLHMASCHHTGQCRAGPCYSERGPRTAVTAPSENMLAPLNLGFNPRSSQWIPIF